MIRITTQGICVFKSCRNLLVARLNDVCTWKICSFSGSSFYSDCKLAKKQRYLFVWPERYFHHSNALQCDHHTLTTKNDDNHTGSPYVPAKGAEKVYFYELSEADIKELDTDSPNFDQICGKIFEITKLDGSDEQAKVIASRLQFLVNIMGMKPTKALNTLLISPECLQPENCFDEVVKFCHQNGLNKKEFISLLIRFPGVLSINVNKLHDFFDMMRSFGFQHVSIKNIFVKMPSLLLVDRQKLETRVLALKQLFKTKDTLKMISDGPKCLIEDWQSIQERFDYVHFVMNVSQRQMMDANLLKHSLLFIKTRHVFAQRTGFFIYEKKSNGKKNKNPYLGQILATSDEAFAKFFGNFTLAEYRVFAKLFEEECKKIDVSHSVEKLKKGVLYSDMGNTSFDSDSESDEDADSDDD